MKKHEDLARYLKDEGNNCSASLYEAFKEDAKLKKDYPEPRSIDGKCGALLTALSILKETGNEEKIDDFEKEFVKKFGFNKCRDLIKNGRNCREYVGQTAKMLDEIIMH